MTNTIKIHYQAEIAAYHVARQNGATPRAWHHLERGHILAQRHFFLHLDSHLKMLSYAIALHQRKEIFGQLARLALVPLGNISGRLPMGNTGRSNISAFQPMDIPADLQVLLDPKD
jgi:Protein of unknown function (DUF3703)